METGTERTVQLLPKINFELWTSADIAPSLEKEHNNIIQCSPILLIQDELRGVIPGYYVKVLAEVYQGNISLQKGEICFIDMAERKINYPLFYYVTDIKKKV